VARHHGSVVPVVAQVRVGQAAALVDVREVGRQVCDRVHDVRGRGDRGGRGDRRVGGYGSAEGRGSEG